MTVTVLKWIGIVIHQMSVTGLIVALGLLVDAAIVMTDNVRHLLRQGESAANAVRGSVGRLTVPLLSSTVTTVLAFVPMATLPGPAGDFVGAIAVSVIVMLATSFLLAIKVVPLLSGWLLAAQSGRTGGRWTGWLRHGVSTGPLGRLFSASLAAALRYPLLGVMAAIVLPVVGFGAFPTLTAQSFPGVDRDQFYVQVYLTPGSSLSETERVARAAGELIAAEPGIRHVHWVMGESAPVFYYNILRNRDGSPRRWLPPARRRPPRRPFRFFRPGSTRPFRARRSSCATLSRARP